jgi:hypothetical protein
MIFLLIGWLIALEHLLAGRVRLRWLPNRQFMSGIFSFKSSRAQERRCDAAVQYKPSGAARLAASNYWDFAAVADVTRLRPACLDL